MQKISFSYNRVVWWLGLTTRLSHEFKLRANCLASLELLSCSAIAGVTFQLPCMLRTCASFGDLPAASHSWDPVASPYRMHSELFFTFSHTLPLHDSHLNTGFLNAELQANWHGIKSTKWLIKFNLTSLLDLRSRRRRFGKEKKSKFSRVPFNPE